MYETYLCKILMPNSKSPVLKKEGYKDIRDKDIKSEINMVNEESQEVNNWLRLINCQ